MDKKFFNDLSEVFETEEDRLRRRYLKWIINSFFVFVISSIISVLVSILSVSDTILVISLFLPIIPFIMLFVFAVLYVLVH